MEATRELLDRRGRLYIGRPEFPVTQDIMSGGNRIVLMTHTERWRNLRKIMHSLLMASNVSQTIKGFLLFCKLTAIKVGHVQTIPRC